MSDTLTPDFYEALREYGLTVFRSIDGTPYNLRVEICGNCGAMVPVERFEFHRAWHEKHAVI